MAFWKEILSIFAINTSVLAIVGWFTKSLIKHLLSKDIENYKNKLKFESDKEIEILKATLRRTAIEYKVRFSRLDAQRAEVINKLHIHLKEAIYAAKILLFQSNNNKSSSKDDKYKMAKKKILSLADYLNRHSLYFTEKLYDDILKITELLGHECSTYKKSCKSSKAKKDTNAWKQIEQNVFEARKALEYEFRSILGVYAEMQGGANKNM